MVSLSPQTSAAVAAIGHRPRDWLAQLREWPLLPLAILVPFVLLALFADYIAPYDPTEPIATIPPKAARPEAKMPREIGGPKGPEPTRYGDWEHNGRCTDF